MYSWWKEHSGQHTSIVHAFTFWRNLQSQCRIFDKMSEQIDTIQYSTIWFPTPSFQHPIFPVYYISLNLSLVSELHLTSTQDKGPFGWIKTFVYPSSLLSNFWYAFGASSIPISCETTKEGLARPEMIMSRRYRLYCFTLH
jgi:hypothetical protein